jgi:DNA-binding CsgD family transcriptional regulator
LAATTPTDEGRERQTAAVLTVVFGAVALLAAADLVGDAGSDASPIHLAVEGAVLLVGLAGSIWMAVRFRALASERRELAFEADRLARRLADSEREAARWREEAGELIAGLGDAIDRQLARWRLSPAEKEVALLLLKGLSHKEIGAVRGTSEATVRQQARALYEKGGLEGRRDLAAFFLEDLLTPRSLPRRTAESKI